MTEPRVALVTGANKGIGKEVARALARHGLVVLLGSRDLDRGRNPRLGEDTSLNTWMRASSEARDTATRELSR